MIPEERVDASQKVAPASQPGPDPEVTERAQPRRFSGAYKLKVLDEYEGLNKAGKGALLRREGLYTSLIKQWRKQREHGALAALAQKPGRPMADSRDRELARLHKQNLSLEREIDKLRKVNEIQVKLSALLEGLAAESAVGEGEQT